MSRHCKTIGTRCLTPSVPSPTWNISCLRTSVVTFSLDVLEVVGSTPSKVLYFIFSISYSGGISQKKKTSQKSLIAMEASLLVWKNIPLFFSCSSSMPNEMSMAKFIYGVAINNHAEDSGMIPRGRDIFLGFLFERHYWMTDLNLILSRNPRIYIEIDDFTLKTTHLG